VTFNKLNTYQWFKEHAYYLDESHDPSDRTAAFAKAIEQDRLPLGIFYRSPKPSFEENVEVYKEDTRPLCERDVDQAKLASLIDTFRMTG
jgi:2-oxoglutarate ferredoxin oxidoreductase subunit beta